VAESDEQAATQRRLKDIVLSTLIVGGGSVVTVLSGVIRGKVISTIVGPPGIGLQGLLQSTQRTTSAIASMGLQTSGVREVARLRGENDATELAHTLRALQFATITLGGIAALVLVLFHRPLAAGLLDDPTLGWMIAVVGIGVLAQVLYCVYDAFLRGFRRVALLTRSAVIANILATALGVLMVVLLGEGGIVWALVLQPVFVLLIAAIAGRDLPKHLVAVDRDRTRKAFTRVIHIGAVLATTSFISTGVQLAARVLIAHSTTINDVGYFQAAWAVSVLYLGFVLGAMSQDYYPRLAETRADPTALSRMVNEQAKVSFLLAGPAILGLLTLSSQVVALLYTSEFTATVQLLRWQLLGDVLKIGSWTLGYLVLAHAPPRVYFMTELSWNVAYLGVLAALLPVLGVQAAAAAYVAASAIYFVVLCVVTNRLVGFAWSRSNVALMAVIAVLSAVAMSAHLFLPRWPALAIAGAVTTVFGLYCARRLIHEAGFARLIRRKK